MPVSDVPHYRERIGYVFDKARWNPDDFALFRVHMAYPILHSVAELVFPIEKE